MSILLILTSCLLSSSMLVTGSSDIDAAMAILDALDASTPEARYERAPLQAVMGDLAERTAVGCWADWDALEALSIDARDELTLDLPEGPLATLLGAVALQLGDAFDRPVFEVYEGQVVLTTLDATNAMAVTDVYDVRDLIEANTDSESGSDADLDSESRSDSDVEPDTSPGTAASAAPDTDRAEAPDTAAGAPRLRSARELVGAAAPPRKRTAAERLWTVIAEHVDPEAWRDLGGSRGVIHDRDGLLVVTAPPTTHRRFRAALARLRRAHPTALELDVGVIDAPRSALDRIGRRLDLDSARLGRALMSSTDASVRWRSGGLVAIGASWKVETASDALDITVRLTPTLDTAAGGLRVAVEALVVEGAESSHVETIVAVPFRDGGAVVELAAPGARDQVRLLVIIPTRR